MVELGGDLMHVQNLGAIAMAIGKDMKEQFENTPPKIRTSLEMTGYLAAIVFVAGVIFNAGVEVNQMVNVQNTQAEHTASIRILQSQLMPINEQLARQDALLSDIRTELRQANERASRKSN